MFEGRYLIENGRVLRLVTTGKGSGFVIACEGLRVFSRRRGLIIEWDRLLFFGRRGLDIEWGKLRLFGLAIECGRLWLFGLVNKCTSIGGAPSEQFCRTMLCVS